MADYVLLDEIGRGGMGTVWRALDRALNREVALKFLNAGLITDERQRLRFDREVSVLAAVSHPNVIVVLDSGERDGHPYYAMELLDGRTLKEAIRATGRLTVVQALAVLDQLLDALEHVHGRGIIHRDVKPSNVIITEPDGRVVLTDFGIARTEGASDAGSPPGDPASAGSPSGRSGHPGVGGPSLRSSAPEPPGDPASAGLAVGSPAYAAPELFRGERPTAASDLWSVGVLAVEALTGQRPFTLESFDALAADVTGRDVRLASIDPHLAPELAGFVDRFLERDPSLRWASAREARAALAHLQVRLHLSPSGRILVPLTACARDQGAGRPRGRLLAFVALLVAGAFIVLTLVRRW